jgi:hypothetical protein
MGAECPIAPLSCIEANLLARLLSVLAIQTLSPYAINSALACDRPLNQYDRPV